ncbi:MAG: hypothetical protein GVY19_04205 [Bacteroidetes bacterium]|jgi:adenylyltransferase/sulfurtransferase|nr:hypothetical protein [Bacteroidota bacterium]
MGKNKILTEQEKRIFSHQIAFPHIGLPGQEKLKKSKVLVIGAGGKGTAVLQQLAKAGVGEIGISDNYLIEEVELPRQMLYGTSELGKLKAIAIKEKLIEANNFTQFNLHNICLSKDNIKPIIENYDVLVDTTDNFPARYLINDAAILLNKPWVFGSVVNSLGMVSVFNYQNGPSLRCHYPTVPKHKNKPPAKGINSWGIILNIVGCIIANEVINIVQDKPTDLSGNILNFNMLEYKISYEQVVKNPQNFTITDIIE